MVMSKKSKSAFSVSLNDKKRVVETSFLISRQGGAVLIGLIITMIIMASLGTGMVYLTTTSTFQELFSNKNIRAHYAAESGGRYAMALIRDSMATGTPHINTLPTNNFASAFTMANTDSFQITNWSTTGASLVITFDVTGTTGSGLLQARRLLNYRINPANQSSPGTAPDALPPGASDFDVSKPELDEYYSPIEMDEVDIKSKKHVDNDAALNLKAAEYTMGLRWSSNVNGDMAQLDLVRANNNNLLSYGVQVKIKDRDVDQVIASPYSMIGVSFRLDDRNDAVLSDDIDNMYAISFVKLDIPGLLPPFAPPDWYINYIQTNSDWDYFSVTNAGYWFVLLWKRTFSGTTPTYAPLAYSKLSSADSVCRDGDVNGCTKIEYWATLMGYIEEKHDGSNEITGYLSQPPTYERSTAALFQTIEWAEKDGDPDHLKIPSQFTPINWTIVSGSGASKQSVNFPGIASPIDVISDSSLTTLNYETYTIGDTSQTKAREIGLHIFAKSESAQNVFYDNFYIDLTPSSGGTGYEDGTGSVDIGG